MLKRKKAQNTAEYAILIALVVGGVVAMQIYAQRALQGRIRDANVTMRDLTNDIGSTLQYEPYYSNSSGTTSRTSEKETFADGATESTNAIKDSGSYDITNYKNASVYGNTTETADGF
jgi:hypothetical protein